MPAQEYDVFISFKHSDANNNKTKDSIIAERLYGFLKDKGLRVFFSPSELEFLGQSQYSKVIDDALDSSNFLIAVGCSRENLDSRWVYYEWDSFLNDIRSGTKPNAEVFVIYADMSVSDLPRALRQRQAFEADESDSFERLYNFIKNAFSSGKRLNIDEYTEAIRLKSDDADAYFNRGHAYGEKGEYDHAIADFTEVTCLRPNDAIAYTNRGIAYSRKGDYDHAFADFATAIRLDADNTDHYFKRGNAYLDKGNYDRAIADYTEVISMDSGYCDAYVNRANAYCAKGDFDRAIADCTEAIRLNPDFAVTHLNRAILYTKKGDYDLAIADCTAAIRLRPDYADAYLTRTIAYRDRGMRKEAETDLMVYEKLKK